MFKKAALTLGLVLGAPFLISAGTAKLAVFPIPETLFGDPAAKLGQVVTAKPGDVLMTGRIMATEHVTVDAPIKVKIDRFDDELAPGEELTPVIAPASTVAMMGGRGHYFCGQDQRGRSAIRSLLIGGIGSKFEAIVRFCFVDSDEDGMLDKVFLAGAKDPALQAPVAIAPAKYHIQRFVQRNEGDVIRLRYRKFVPEKMKIELELEVFHNGKKEGFDFLRWSKSNDVSLRTMYPRLESSPKKVPYPAYFNDVLGASIKMDNVRPDGTVDFSIMRNFGPVLFRAVVIQVRYIYIYM